MLVDSCVISVSSGKGGDGHVSFRREKYINKGGPTGGDGGDGGDVYLVATAGVDTLLDLTSRHHWAAQNGEDGGKKQCIGACGEDLLIQIPPGTLVFDEETNVLIADLDQPGMKILVAKGGRGGWGNEHFKSSTNQTPREVQPGEPAQTRKLRFELKLIADIGLIGKPNAGKSTLLSRISRATPKIADYPFTTLEPQLGIAELSGFRRIVMADIPGLIEGASQGQGLGIEFLRHVERTRALVHLIEMEPTDGSDPVKNYFTIREELAAYSPELAQKPELIVLSKMDTFSTKADRDAAAELIEQGIKRKTLRISSASGQGLPELLERCWILLDKPNRTSSTSTAWAAPLP